MNEVVNKELTTDKGSEAETSAIVNVQWRRQKEREGEEVDSTSAPSPPFLQAHQPPLVL